MSKIFVLNGHPAEESLSKALCQAYVSTAKTSGNETRICHLHDMQFDIDYGFAGYSQTKPLEPDLELFVKNLDWCEHFVLAAPMWWGGLPGKLKGLFDRALLPGQAFDPRNTKMGMPAPLLTGRSGRVFITADTPRWAMSLLYRSAMIRQVEGQILGFIGLKPVKTSFFAPTSDASEKTVQKWLEKARRLGTQAA